MKKTLFWQAMLVMAAVVGAQPAPAAASEGATLLVIPSRYTVVQFAFDVARTRSLYLLAYERPATGGDTKIYAWDNGGAKWVGVEASAVRNGSIFNEAPAQVVLVGDDRTLPDAVGAAVDPNGKAKRITSLQLVDILNGLDGVLHFTPREWKWFAGRYGFTLDDRNAERRRWGRYGPPGGGEARSATDAVAAPAGDDVVMPVAVPEAVIEEPAPEQQTLVIPAAEQGAPAAPDVVAEPAAPAEAVPVGAATKPEDK